MNFILGVLVLGCAVVIIEVNDFRIVSIILGLQGVFLGMGFILEGMWFEAVPITLFSILVVPVLLFLVTKKTKSAEERPLIPILPSTGLLVALIVITYAISFFLILENFLVSLIIAGAYGLLVKTDLRKSVASLTLLFNAIHSFTASFDLLIQVVLTAFSLILLAILLYFAIHIFSLKGSLSTKDLKELRF